MNQTDARCAQGAYRGRLAPSPTGYLHLGHARTFWIAQERARRHGGVLILRNEDLDPERCREPFAAAMIEDLRWFGLHWEEGPDCGGPCGPYVQSQRRPLHAAAFAQLEERGFIYPCACSRQDIQRALQAPHAGEEEPIYPGTCRPEGKGVAPVPAPAKRLCWRFRVPDGQAIAFVDQALGPQSFVGGKDFGDFVVWRHDGAPSYQLAVVVDDAAMGVTEVVRGSDLLLSTARQLLLYRALGLKPPAFYHCALVCGADGVRLAKRHDALSLRMLRSRGQRPEDLRSSPMFQPKGGVS